MYKHQIQEHKGDPVYHTFTLVKSCTTPLERQIKKIVVIRQTKERGGNITNIKQEFNRCWIPRLVMDQGNTTAGRATNAEANKEIGEKLEFDLIA